MARREREEKKNEAGTPKFSELILTQDYYSLSVILWEHDQNQQQEMGLKGGIMGIIGRM